ncbi:hypothetical protein MY4038_001256 [Beauveria bassiana]
MSLQPLSPRRVITDTNLDSGLSHFSTSINESVETEHKLGGTVFRLAYCFDRPTHSLKIPDDVPYLESIKSTATSPVVVPDHHTMIWYIDTPPGGATPLHRTLSLDVVVQIKGEIEVILDSGEKRVQKPGDVLIQKATAHAWRNHDKKKWSRMVGMRFAVDPITLNNGTQLGAVI